MSPGERGLGLLEVVAALAILSVAGLSLLATTSATVREVAQAAERARLLAAEERLLAVHALLERGDLDRRLGIREYGAFVVRVQRPTPDLYRIAVAAAAVPDLEDLVTVVFRPDSADAR